MEDVLKFLFVIAVIGVGIFRQLKKEQPRKPVKPSPAPVPPPAGIPLAPAGDEEALGSARPRRQPRPSTRRRAEGGQSGPHRQPPVPAVPPGREEEESGYAIRSAEEARKAIIWGEILNRKY